MIGIDCARSLLFWGSLLSVLFFVLVLFSEYVVGVVFGIVCVRGNQ